MIDILITVSRVQIRAIPGTFRRLRFTKRVFLRRFFKVTRCPHGIEFEGCLSS